MSVDAKAYLKGNVPFEEIEGFMKRITTPKATYKTASENDDARCAWIDFEDATGKSRSAFLFRSNLPDSALAEEIAEETQGIGVTVVSLFADSEGVRITREITERFGGWHQPSDCVEEYDRILMKAPSPEDGFVESAEIWKVAARRLKDAADEFAARTRNLDPRVLEVTEWIGTFRLNGGTLRNSLESAEAALDAATRRIRAEKKDDGTETT